ncbi:MAG: HEPN domain-containing protein, partial [Actinomycetota bacterium]|nr:HEPN domain-containing protein [Actinomycetota bacterium]
MQAPLDEEEFRRWRDQAARALEAARLAGEGGQHEWACFLSEQAAQLAVKGLLHGAGLEAWGHDLTLLSSRVAAEL